MLQNTDEGTPRYTETGWCRVVVKDRRGDEWTSAEGTHIKTNLFARIQLDTDGSPCVVTVCRATKGHKSRTGNSVVIGTMGTQNMFGSVDTTGLDDGPSKRLLEHTFLKGVIGYRLDSPKQTRKPAAKPEAADFSSALPSFDE